MKHNARFLMLTHTLLGCLLLLSGCATSQPVSRPPSILLPSSQSPSLLEETKAEAEELRSALAAERIALAKQQAEVRAAQHELSDIRKREAMMIEEIRHFKEEIAQLKADREHMHTENAQLRGKTNDIPQLLQLMTEIRSLQTSLNSLVSDVHLLKTDISTLKTAFRNNQKTIQVNRQRSRSFVHTQKSEGNMLTVQPGDSLWNIARTHGISVQQLQELNNLEGTLIFPGQQLYLRMKVVQQHDTNKASTNEVSSPLEPAENP